MRPPWWPEVRDGLARILGATDVTSVLGRETDAELLNISGSGCLIETSTRIDVGTAGLLRMTIQGTEYHDDVRVARCQAIEGAGAKYHIGAEFLWTTAPGEQSLRRLVVQLRGAAVKAAEVRFESRQAM
jgi:hypothetical protein